MHKTAKRWPSGNETSGMVYGSAMACHVIVGHQAMVQTQGPSSWGSDEVYIGDRGRHVLVLIYLQDKRQVCHVSIVINVC